MHVAVLGASGKAGSELTKELLARGHTVIAVGRTADTLPAGEGITQKVADMSSADAMAEAVQGADAVISALHFNIPADTFTAALKQAGVRRVIFTGGAASLYNAEGTMIYDTPGFPDFLKPIVRPAVDFLQDLRGEKELDWTFFSPAMTYFVGDRTGTFRTGTDQMIFDDNGESKISYADSAIAMVDELEQGNHIQGRFTAAY